MIGLDTNVVVRYLTQDDPEQAARATAVVEGLTDAEPGFLSLVTTVELYWVLRRSYGLGVDSTLDLISRLLDTRELRLDRSDLVRTAVARGQTGADFADALVAEVGRAAGCARTVTFDRRAARTAGMHLLD